MIPTLIVLALALWIAAMGRTFYRHTDWDAPPEPSPDWEGMHKRQAELLRIQEVLETAAAEGKLSPALIAEYNRFCDREIQSMEALERSWKERRKK
jgi:hypothetical protein